MHKITSLLFLFYIFAFQTSAFTEENPLKEKKDLKTLILIIATNDKPAYQELQKVWEIYMNSDPAHFEVYFLRADPTQTEKAVVNKDKNEITLKTHEGFVPGILNKTLMAFEAIEPRLDEFDYVIRTNLSSFYYYPNLLNFLNTLPRTNCYCGVSLGLPLKLSPEISYISFVSGSGIILSKDLARLLAKDHNELKRYKNDLPDDVFIGLFYQSKLVSPYPANRVDFPLHQMWLDSKDSIDPTAFHFRAKNSYELRSIEDPYAEELATLKGLVEKFYPQKISLSEGEKKTP